ncbi:hypothetical protein IE53DRAFT_383935 [Violaceomyces palustris]|uniref:Uncharacterized protein n=1 Tax=Violaceomyces palustris TaxID=1673888 RepID=A0ACD0P689_9BASI|nr:hypothetical protein IE53DRAFT_383935 [Violaceomyces palustris]
MNRFSTMLKTIVVHSQRVSSSKYWGKKKKIVVERGEKPEQKSEKNHQKRKNRRMKSKDQERRREKKENSINELRLFRFISDGSECQEPSGPMKRTGRMINGAELWEKAHCKGSGEKNAQS